MQGVDAFLLGRRTDVTHAEAFEPLPPGDPFGDLMNPPTKCVVSRTLEKPIWRNTTIIRDDVIQSVRALVGLHDARQRGRESAGRTPAITRSSNPRRRAAGHRTARPAARSERTPWPARPARAGIAPPPLDGAMAGCRRGS